MKKVLTFILILFTLLIALPFQNASAKGATVDAFRLTLLFRDCT